MRTYQQILRTMEEEYERLSGVPAAEASDIGIRLRLLAGEILSLENSLQWMQRQWDPRTATGEYLDRLATQVGVSRKGEVKAGGTLLFGRGTTLDYDLTIPAGSVCATEDGLWEYVTTEDVRLAKGSTGVTAKAEAVLGGSDSGCGAGRINVIVTAPEGVETVTNEEAFTGGREAESDELLRERVLLAGRLVPAGGNRNFYINSALSFEGISSAGAVHDGNGNIRVSLYGSDAPPSGELIARVQEFFEENCPLNVNVTAAAAEATAVGISVRIKPKAGYGLEEARLAAEAAIMDYYRSLKVGDGFLMARVYAAVMGCGYIENCSISGSDHAGSAGSIITPGTVTVWEMAE